jgi:hypothetical protein
MDPMRSRDGSIRCDHRDRTRLTVPDGRVASDFSSDAFGAVRANRLDDDDDGDRSSRSPRSTGGRRL